MLSGWNFDNYVYSFDDFYLQRTSLSVRKFLFLTQLFHITIVSLVAYIFICLDRYLTLSRLHRTWFNDSKPLDLPLSVQFTDHHHHICLLLQSFIAHINVFTQQWYSVLSHETTAHNNFTQFTHSSSSSYHYYTSH